MPQDAVVPLLLGVVRSPSRFEPTHRAESSWSQHRVETSSALHRAGRSCSSPELLLKIRTSAADKAPVLRPEPTLPNSPRPHPASRPIASHRVSTKGDKAGDCCLKATVQPGDLQKPACATCGGIFGEMDGQVHRSRPLAGVLEPFATANAARTHF